MKISAAALRVLSVSSLMAVPFVQACSNPWTCQDAATCFKCVGSEPAEVTGFTKYEINFYDCKQEEISWACCTGSTGPDPFNPGSSKFTNVTENADACQVYSDKDKQICMDGPFGTDENGNVVKETNKCNGVIDIYVIVPDGATSARINSHDGKTQGDAYMDNANCGGKNPQQGGSCAPKDSGISAHCMIDVDLTNCGGGGSTGGTTPPGPPVCEPPNGKVEDCLSKNNACTKAVWNPDPSVCDCEITFEQAGTVCEAADRFQCRSQRVCDGSGLCEDPVPLGTDIVCRDSVGICDKDDYCDGQHMKCGTDEKHGADKTCRYAKDSCDFAEVCDGTNDICPCDRKRDLGYTMKCGQDLFMCGVTQLEMDKKTSGRSQVWSFAGTNVGKPSAFIELDYDECIGTPIEEYCPEVDGKSHRLSNFVAGQCVENGTPTDDNYATDPATWTSYEHSTYGEKLDVDADTPFPLDAVPRTDGCTTVPTNPTTMTVDPTTAVPPTTTSTTVDLESITCSVVCPEGGDIFKEPSITHEFTCADVTYPGRRRRGLGSSLFG